MNETGWMTAHWSQIPPVEGNDLTDADWRAIRHYFGISAFGTNLYVAGAPGEITVEEHDELDDTGGPGHEEMYVVLTGRAEFTVAGEQFEARPGTFVFLGDPALTRKAVALEAGTAILAVGGAPGAHAVSRWEQRYARPTVAS